MSTGGIVHSLITVLFFAACFVCDSDIDVFLYSVGFLTLFHSLLHTHCVCVCAPY